MFVSIDTYETQKELSNMIDSNSGESALLKRIKPIRYKNIDKKFLSKLISHFIKSDEKDNPNYKFQKKFYEDDYNSFMDFFTRKLTNEKFQEIQNNIKGSQLVIPNECYIEALGTMGDTKEILRLKKPHKNRVSEDLKKLGIDVKGYSFIDMKLFLTFYHGIHSPVNGFISNMFPVEQKDDMFGNNSLWIVTIDTTKSSVYLLLVGESAIQDFDFIKEKKTDIQLFEKLGFFNWGSQVIVLYDPKNYKELKIKENENYFVGESIY
jgi:phosphatidylserine decarboxylase